MSQLLSNEGVVFISFIEGESEGFEDPTGNGKQRFFSKFTQNELYTLLSTHLSIIEMHKIDVKKMQQTILLMVLKFHSC